jgi:hypothetical protein
MIGMPHAAKTVKPALQRAANSPAKTLGASWSLPENAMDNLQSSRRSDEQLEAILCETGHWVVNGRQGQVLCYAASLRQAIDRSEEFSVSGAVVIAICRLPFDNIILFPEQIDRLRRGIVRELVSGTRPDASYSSPVLSSPAERPVNRTAGPNMGKPPCRDGQWRRVRIVDESVRQQRTGATVARDLGARLLRQPTEPFSV